MKVTKAEKQKALEYLRSIIQPGDTVWTVLRHCAPSGMTRWIDLYLIRNSDRIWLSAQAAMACGFAYDDKRECVKVGGCGMDMGFHLVYNLSSVLFHDNFTCIGEHCPSNDHNNGDRDYKPHKHTDGGYALRQSWL